MAKPRFARQEATGGGSGNGEVAGAVGVMPAKNDKSVTDVAATALRTVHAATSDPYAPVIVGIRARCYGSLSHAASNNFVTRTRYARACAQAVFSERQRYR